MAACFIVAGGGASEVLDAIEEWLDLVARPVKHQAEAGFPASMSHWRDVGRGTSGFDLPAQSVGIIDLVGQHDGALVHMSEQTFGDRAVADLAWCQDELERLTCP